MLEKIILIKHLPQLDRLTSNKNRKYSLHFWPNSLIQQMEKSFQPKLPNKLSK